MNSARVRLAAFFNSHYKAFDMLTSLLIAVSIWGADPDIVFSSSGAPNANSVVQSSSYQQSLVPLGFPSTIVPASFTTVAVALPNKGVRPLATTDDSDTEHNGEGVRPLYWAKPLAVSGDPSEVVRGQTVGDRDCGRTCELASTSLWEHPVVKEFISGMNPFVDEVVHTLPGYYDPYSFQMKTGSFGPQGYRLGWISYNDLTLLPSATAVGTAGSMQIFEWNSNVKYSGIIAPGVILSGTGFFNARWWNGPDGTAVPGQVDQISTDLELGFYNDGPWSGQIAFHPQIVETYDARLDRNAFNFDGRAITTYKASPEWSFVGGLAVWDRVDLMVVPHVGAIWTPNNRWEFRMLFPKSRISYFVGKWRNADFWLYGQAEYTAEAWQSFDKETANSDRIQLTDNRVSLGLRWDRGRYSFFTEGGFVFNRHVKFASQTPAFDLSNTGMIRVGLRY